MAQRIEQEVAEHKPAALLLDLSQLDYDVGDSIFTVFHGIGLAGSNTMTLRIPCAVVSCGKTFTGLAWQFKPNPEESFLGVPLYVSRQEALVFLVQRIEGQEPKL
jgi:hypothetical protein